MLPSISQSEPPISLLAINEELVLATLRAQELAEEVEAANRLVAESEERFRSLVTSTSAIVWYADASGNVRTDPMRWREITGLDSTYPGGGWLQGIHLDDRARVAAAWRQAFAERSIFECEYRLCKRDGGVLWVFSRAVPLPVGGGPVREWIGMMSDISERKRAEELRERFIGVLGHDLRSPLTAIKLGAQLMQRSDDLPEHHSRMTSLMSRCSIRMERMIADVLDFARGRLGHGIPLSSTPTNFRQVCENAIVELRVANPEQRITFECSEDLEGMWDPDRLGQVLSNLVGNAAVHGVGPVAVSLRSDAEAVVLEVHNNGAPIPADAIRHIFDPFHRGENHGKGDGLGLGLYIVSEIVRAHGGTISVRSTLAEGTTFVSRWPRLPPPSDSAAAVTPPN